MIKTWIVIPMPIPNLFSRLMPELGKPILARKYPQKMQNKTFYLVSVKDPEDGRRYFLSVNEEAVPRYQVYRRQDGEVIRRITQRFSPAEVARFCEMLDVIAQINFEELEK